MMTSRSKVLNPASFVVIGDGLAAGAGDFGMSEELQPYSFPALVAERLGTSFTQPVMEAPGIGPVIGFPDLPVRLPQAMQTTVLKEFPPAGPFSNVSIPGLKLTDALTRRPAAPLVHRSDGLQTAINLVLGLAGLTAGGNRPLPTLIEYASALQPTLVLIALGYYDALAATFAGNAAAAPDAATFHANYARALAAFDGSSTTILTCTVPDPADTACVTPVSAAARVLKAEPEVVCTAFGLKPTDCLTPSGLFEAGTRLIMRNPGPLPEGSIVGGDVVAAISRRVDALNVAIRAASNDRRATVFDLHGLFRSLKQNGAVVGRATLSADYLGGIYSLNGVYPGAVGHGLIANALLDLLNADFGAGFGAVDLDRLASFDPVVAYRPATGPSVTAADLAAMATARRPVRAPKKTRAAAPEPAPEPMPGGAPIKLPKKLQITLPINEEASYFGDALRAAHATLERDIAFGSSPNTLFGGLCMTQSHVTGSVTFRFTPPKDNVTRFTMSVGEGLTGQDGVLAAPQLYRLPSIMNKVTDVPGLVSSGDLDLATGEVSNLKVYVAFMNSALLALVSVNPKIPPTPIEFSNGTRQDPSNPHYGSAWAKFSQRTDGTLDFHMSGISFLPLGGGFGGDMLRFPLPFSGPAMQFASVPAVGTALHPHIMISTTPPDASGVRPEAVPEIPTNTIREYTAFTHNTAFGDRFSLNVPELEGGATGRSHLLGRVLIQFGARSGHTVPVSVSTLTPGGFLVKPPESPIAKVFPGRLSLGLLGHDETLRYKTGVHYDLHGVAWADDPFEVSLGSIDLKTGRLLGTFLFRGFIIQDVLLNLLRLEPRTPKSSWYMRGPAAFEKDPAGQTAFNFTGTVRMPYPEGYGFPKPDFQSCFTVGPDSALDPYIYIQAMDGIAPPSAGKSGAEESVVASNGQRFSYRYAIHGDPSKQPGEFEYVNETTGGAFRMSTLVWVSFTNANRPCSNGDCDAVSFTGIGAWSQDPTRPHIATVQISTAPDYPYVSIIVDGGFTSNVNTKPAKAVMPFPEYLQV